MTEDHRSLQTAAGHGTNIPRGLHATGAASGRGRFGRMFPFLPAADLSDDSIDELVRVMAEQGGSENPDIPAGYTYLGQFIDHDITFDPTSQLQKLNDPFALADFRTPRLDLDSVYGSGPADQPFLYDWSSDGPPGVKLLVDRDTVDPSLAIEDLPRNSEGRALVGDPRNDENLIIAQLHLLFVHFHNKIVDQVRALRTDLAADELFRGAQRTVRWHYQWIVFHDFLPRVAGAAVTASVLRPAGCWPPVERKFYRWEGNEPYIPVEFSGAAYRFGHSMVRDSYQLNRTSPTQPPIFSPDGEDLHGFRPLPAARVIEWEFFFPTTTPSVAQLSRRIDTNIAAGLSGLPAAVASHSALPWLNLTRGRALGLPSGREVARAMGEAPLNDDDLLLAGASSDARRAVLAAPPLWYYVLCEAAKAPSEGKHLGPVGGRIVAEVLIGLGEADEHSYLRQWPSWTPELAAADGRFTMADLVAFVRP